MAKVKMTAMVIHEPIHKRTSIGGGRPKMSSMNKAAKRSYKKYRGQGRCR